MDEDQFLELLEEYTIPAAVIPLEGWATEDLVMLHNAIDAELQNRYDASVAQAAP